MVRAEVIQIIVLNEVSDDYENLAYIQEHAVPYLQQNGISISVEDVVSALICLIDEDLVSSYNLWTSPVTEIQGKPPTAQMEELYFYQTSKGKELNAANSKYFDGAGMLLGGALT